MPGPIDSLRFVHAALLHEVAYFDDAVAGDLTADRAKTLLGELATLHTVVVKHTGGEEVGLFPRLAEKEPHYAETYLHDHVNERALMDELKAGLESVVSGADVTPARRAAAQLRAHATAHITKENEYVLPLVAELFTPPEQGAIVQAILSTIAPPEMAAVVPWIVRRLDDDMAVTYVGILEKAMPPEVFEKAKGWLAEGLEADQLARLKERAPALA